MERSRCLRVDSCIFNVNSETLVLDNASQASWRPPQRCRPPRPRLHTRHRLRSACGASISPQEATGRGGRVELAVRGLWLHRARAVLVGKKGQGGAPRSTTDFMQACGECITGSDECGPVLKRLLAGATARRVTRAARVCGEEVHQRGSGVLIRTHFRFYRV